jgi:hypothetical protein
MYGFTGRRQLYGTLPRCGLCGLEPRVPCDLAFVRYTAGGLLTGRAEPGTVGHPLTLFTVANA